MHGAFQLVYSILCVYTALACQTIPPMGRNFSAVKPLDIRVVAVDIFVFVYFVATCCVLYGCVELNSEEYEFNSEEYE